MFEEILEKVKNEAGELKEKTLEEYSDVAWKTASYVSSNKSSFVVEYTDGTYAVANCYPFLGLLSEAGEVAGKIKKKLMTGSNVNPEDLMKELGDVLWYVNACAREIGVSLEDIAQYNTYKLHKRKKEGKLVGDGDER
jgi:NTP pyrophosphatase (non-canonical NTP hydrolase)